MTNSSVGDLMFFGVRSFGWVFWYWHRIKQKIGRGGTMNLCDKIYSKVITKTIKNMDWYKYEVRKREEMERERQ